MLCGRQCMPATCTGALDNAAVCYMHWPQIFMVTHARSPAVPVGLNTQLFKPHDSSAGSYGTSRKRP